MRNLEEKLAQAVRNSLNLPRLRVSVRRHRLRRSWSFCLHKERACSDWLELDSSSIEIMEKLGLLPALHLGTFRIAYAALRQATEGETKPSPRKPKGLAARRKRAPGQESPGS